MARLPQPGGDTGTWGDILNDYLVQVHNADGTLKTGIVTSNNLATGAVNNSSLQDNSVNGSKLLDDSISETKLDTVLVAKVNALGSDPLVGGDLSGSASNAQIVAGAVGTAEIADQSVTTLKLADANVTTGKLANGAVDGTKLASDAVTNIKIANGTIGETKLDAALQSKVNGIASVADGSITPIKLSSDIPASGEVLSYNGTGFEWVTPAAGGGGGEANTAANIGIGGVGVYKQKTGVQFELKRVRAASSKVTVSDNTVNNTIDLDVDTASLGLTKSDIGLGNVDNTSDINKPVSTATQTALNAKATTATTITGTLSLAGGGTLAANRTLSLVGDSATPGSSMYYGTNGVGTKGYYSMPAQDPALGGDLTGTASNAQIAAGVVGATELATNAVTTIKILDANITDAKVATGISQSKISNLTTDLAGKASTVHVHAAGDITSGTVASARLGSGTASSTTFLRGDNTWAVPVAGESNTASNVGIAGVGLFKQKTGVNLEFKNINAASNKISITNDAANNEVDIDVVTANLGLVKGDVGLGNVDNTSDATKNSAAVTLTNKTISGASNTLSNIAQSSVTNLTSDLAAKEPSLVAGTIAQYYRGDKSWQTLDKTAVGLANVDNTSDANKPVSSATQTALNGKVNTSAVGAASGVASLDVSGKLPSTQLLVGYADIPAGSMITVFKSGGVWPVRPTSRSDIAVRWRGAAPGPTIGGAYAIDGVDDWDEV